jgi:branched-chain amino acid transport system ATP-binding protein
MEHPLMSALLSVEGIQVIYQRAIVGVHDVSFKAQAGQIIVLLGANGAGKTTTLRAITGFLGLDDAKVGQGHILFDGTRIENLPPYETARGGIILVPEREKVFPNLTVSENLAVPVAYRVTRSERMHREDLVYEMFPRLAGLRRRVGGLLSGGERQMLGLACALVSHPQLLLIDELSLGLAPIVLEALMQQIVRIRDELGIGIVMVEQNAVAALAIADYAYVLENGRIAIEGLPKDLRKGDQMQQSYFGGSGASGQRSYRDLKRDARQGLFDG